MLRTTHPLHRAGTLHHPPLLMLLLQPPLLTRTVWHPRDDWYQGNSSPVVLKTWVNLHRPLQSIGYTRPLPPFSVNHTRLAPPPWTCTTTTNQPISNTHSQPHQHCIHSNQVLILLLLMDILCKMDTLPLLIKLLITVVIHSHRHLKLWWMDMALMERSWWMEMV